MGWLAGSGRSDARAFAARVVHLDPAAVVRLRPAGEDAVALWSRLPWGVLVTRGIAATVARDRTVAARDLLTPVDDLLPVSRDTDWRWSLPPGPGTTVERVPAADVRRVGAAAAETVRTASAHGVGGRPIGSRMLRDALLDHEPIVVTTDAGRRIPVTQRLVQAVIRMGFVAGGPDEFVDVRISGPWTALACTYGSAWHRGGGSLLIG
ncbi:hypothetical protein Dvina_46665 [Dactylosporangium vinaceum]|uniref:Uncharacterized protein n=1 Tax=Dactylosporangium vinaceum TaxID=53362 RepID=A0ABV5M7L0_9ACTN|nr:hypothetical protein [Dactylosporangium vinaceum]UAB95428.1 hypothetical protein Dvina_46665 [Dactylosporangium vinaceum]